MLLVRQGNKRRIAKEIIKYFPEHNIYIEPFFGAGGIFFNKKKAKYNFVNDLDEETYNLFQVIINKPKQFENLLKQVPKHRSLFAKWKKYTEKNEIWRAVRFVYLSNFSYMGGRETMKFGIENTKAVTLRRIKETFHYLGDTTFDCKPYDKFLKGISLKSEKNKSNIFIYCDPPYISTIQKYYTPKWNTNDFKELIQELKKIGSNFAISEFDDTQVIEVAKEEGLNIIEIGERQNLKNIRKEILIVNYEIKQ